MTYGEVVRALKRAISQEAERSGRTFGMVTESWIEQAADDARYARLGRACESNGLGWFDEDGAMRFQAPAELIERTAYQRGWDDRESDILERAERILPPGSVP
jgi:hypothetical protein